MFEKQTSCNIILLQGLIKVTRAYTKLNWHQRGPAPFIHWHVKNTVEFQPSSGGFVWAAGQLCLRWRDARDGALQSCPWITQQFYLPGRPRATFWGPHLRIRQHRPPQGDAWVSKHNTFELSPPGAAPTLSMGQPAPLELSRCGSSATGCPGGGCRHHFTHTSCTASIWPSPPPWATQQACLGQALATSPISPASHSSGHSTPHHAQRRRVGCPLQPTLGTGMSTAWTASGSCKNKTKKKMMEL